MDGCDSIGRSRNCSVNDCDTAKSRSMLQLSKNLSFCIAVCTADTLSFFITIN